MGCGCLGGTSKKGGGGFKKGHHTSFVFRTLSKEDPAHLWVTAVRDHAVAKQVREASGRASSEELANPTVSFFRGKATKPQKKRSWKRKADDQSLPAVQE